MARRDDEEPPWTRQLLVGVGAIAVVALVIGGVVGAIALGAARVSGIDSAAPRATQKPSLYIPSGTPTVGLDTYPAPSGGAHGGPTVGPSSSSSASPDGPKSPPITLRVFPRQVAAGQRINLTGLYPGGNGVRLQVQRLENGRWTDFPVTVPVSAGQFTTYVTTSHSGVNRFRLLDSASQHRSNPVKVTVG
jgi:hypothetical protein